MISIHALLAESDASDVWLRRNIVEFLSTLSLRRATRHDKGAGTGRRNFYPRSPCGERPDQTQYTVAGQSISIHALLAESDVAITIRGLVTPVISIHALLAESDFRGDHGHISGDISIHALLAESDLPRFPPGSEFPISIHALLAESDQSPVSLDPINIYNFYPRSPCGERRCFGTCTFTDF